MIIRIDPTSGPTVDQPSELTSFHATSPTADEDAVAAALGPAGRTAGQGHVWISADWIRSEVAGRVEPGWVESFDGMVAYARSKGWLDDDGSHIRAHIELDGG